MIAKWGSKLSDISERVVPDPIVFALLLSLFVWVFALVFGAEVQDLSIGQRIGVIGHGWFKELFSTGLMKFALQMCLILLVGHALALTPLVQALVRFITSRVASPRVAVVVVLLVACAASLIQWGLGAIVGALMAREMGEALKSRGIKVHYPLLGAAGYAGFVVWHGGLSGSAPLKVAEANHFLVDSIGVIPITETILAPMNIAITGALILVMAGLFWVLSPSENIIEPMTTINESEEQPRGDMSGFVSQLEHGPWLGVGFGLLVLSWVAFLLVSAGVAAWHLDTVNLLFFGLGLLLHRSPIAYMKAILDGARGAGPIIIQFPLYFGILGVLISSGLIEQISATFIAISSEETYPILTFVSAGVVNFFVPSGGGQWAVQGPLMVEALNVLEIPASTVVMALAYGDAWTNMLQPFWALPLLGIMGLRARDIMGYTAFVWMISGPVVIFGLWVLG